MDFTTIELVRIESWFDDNDNIGDTLITSYITQATWIVAWSIWSIYDLNAIGFWGTEFDENYIWSPAEKFLTWIATQLASWYLLKKEYWEDPIEASKDGSGKIKNAEDLLDRIVSWGIRLLWKDLKEFTKASVSEKPLQWLVGSWLQSNNWVAFFKIDKDF